MSRFIIDSDKHLKEAVISFRIAADKLLVAMNQIDPDTDYGKYPFDKSFDELLLDIDEWESSLIFKYDK